MTKQSIKRTPQPSSGGTGASCVLVVAATVLGGVTPAHADPIQLAVGQQERYSDNIRLSHTSTESDLESRTYLSIKQHSGQGKCQSDVNGEIGYRQYLNNSYSDQMDANAGMGGNCTIADGFSWNAKDHIAQVPQNSALPNTPNNSVRRNIFSTGPQWLWLMNPRDSLSLSSTYGTTNYWGASQPASTTNLTGQRNNHRVTGSATFKHRVDPSLWFGVGGNLSRTFFNDEIISQRSGNLLFDKNFAATEFSGSVGYSRLEDSYQGVTNTSSGPVWHLNLKRQVNEHSSWHLSYGQEYTDSSSSYVVQIAGLNFNYQQTSAVKVTTYRAGYNNQFSDGSQLGVGLGRTEQNYLLTATRDTTDSANVSLTRPVAAEWTATAGLGYQHEHFGLRNTTNDTYNGYVGTQYQRTRSLSFNARIGHNLRSSNQSDLAYAENFALVGVRYNFQ